MENYFENKHKPLGSRIFAVLTAFIAGLSIIGNNSFIAKAESNSDKSVVQPGQGDDIPELDLDEPGYIIDDNPEVTAKFTPLSEEELAEIEALRFESLKTATVKAGEENEADGFIYSIDHVYELANSSLKHFLYQYSFTSTEVQEGDTSNYIVRTDNFVPKGVITINVEHLIDPGHIEFRVPMYLFQYRNGEYCKINSIGAPAFKTGFTPVKDSNGIYDIANIDAYKSESKQTSFNYYIDNETKEYVFVNYGALASGSTDIQVSYDKVDVFNVTDDTEWDITPKANIVFFGQKSGNLRYNGQIVKKSDGTRTYFTECDLTEDGNTSKIYMLGAETDSSSGLECILYCDVTGTPVFLHTVENATSENKWYDLRGKGKTIEMSYAEIRGGLSPVAEEDIPSIEVSYDNVVVKKDTADSLRGRVDTDVTLDSVTKSPEPNNSSGYGSQVYSKGQMKKYISVDDLPYQVRNGSGLSDDYIYTCWRVYTKGKCTQPWSMLLKDTPKVAKFKSGTNELVTDSNGDVIYYDVPGALVLGVSTMIPNNYSKRPDHKVSESSTDDIRRLRTYVDSSDLSGKNDCWYVADTNTEMRGSFSLQNVTKEHKYNTGYYVVVAYPKSALTLYQDGDIDQYPPLKNEVTLYLYSRDKTSNDEKSAEADGNIVYKKFEWTGGEESWHTYKRVDGECKDGLLSVYDELAGDPDDYIGDIWFHESYRGGAYSCCHNKQTYSHIDGSYYKVINTDDVLTAQPYGEIKVGGALKRVYGKPQTLDGKDYFYSKAVLTLSEFEVDPFEDNVYSLDAAAASEEILEGHSDKINRDWVVYGWYDGGTDWVEIDLTKFGYAHAHFTMQDYIAMKKGSDKVCLTLNFMDKGYKCPFRLKVEHNCIGYNTRLNWDLETQLKLDSPKLNRNGSLRGSNTFCYLDESSNVVQKSASELDFETFRISLRNYSATKATKYEAEYDPVSDKVVETAKGELITNFNEAGNRYYNIEGWEERTLVNANRYLYIDGDKFFDDSTFVHCNKDNMPKSDLGTALLKADRLESPYGSAEYLPLKYINGAQTFSDLDEFIAANSHVYRDHAAIDVSLLETDAHAEKFATWENDTRNGQVVMTYTLSGYEGYKLSKELKQLVENLNVLTGDALPTRNKVVLCDLLPLGVNYYGNENPVLGKLTTTKVADSEDEDITADMVDDYVSTWDKSGAHLDGVEVIENWEGTNRTMVKFIVEFDNTDAILTDSNWFIGCGIRFKAYVAWDNYSSAREKDNIFAYAVHSEDTHNGGNIYGRYSGTSDSQVYDGAGEHIPESNDARVDYTLFKNKTLPDTKTAETAHNRMYGHANDMESITMARTLGIKKQVRADDNIYADYDEITSVVKNHNYTYKIHVDKTAQGSVGDVVIFDQIEKIGWEHAGNFGTFQGLDLTELIQSHPELEDDITIYYSKDRLAPTTLYKLNNSDFIFRPHDGSEEIRMQLAENVYEAQGIERIPWDFDTVNSLIETNYNSSDKWDKDEQNLHDLSYYQWVKSTDYSGAISDVKSIAISFGDHVFDNAFTFNIYVKMKAPNGENDNFALNEASYFFNDRIETENFEYSKSEIVVVTFGDEKILDVIKKVVGVMPDEIDDSYTFKIVSYLKYQENDVGKEFDFSNVGYALYKENSDDHLIHATNIEGEFKLKDKEMAEFSSVAVVENQTGAYDFANFRIIEKSAPYLLSVESVNTVPGDHGNNKEQVTFTNYYRPVIYLTKKTKGVPDGVTLDDSTFSYKIKLYEGDSTTPLSFADGSGYTLLSKETAGEDNIRREDAREDNKLYWYKVQESAGWYETPQGWKVNDSFEGLYKKNDNITFSAFDNTDKSFTVTFKSGETVAVPIYIQHIDGGKDKGMLDENGKPRYRIEIEEVEENDWYCASSKRSGELGAGENSYIWVNNYMYKELLVKKTVTHAPSESILRSTPFTFKLTDKNGAPYYEYKAGMTVNWQLCTMDQQGNITPLEGEDKSGTVANDGTFTVTGCGNASDSTGDAYVIKLSYVKLENGGKTAEYTVTEVDLDSDYSASRVSDTVDVKANAVYTTANIENDYLKRDITINKIVAAENMPGADKKFNIVLCPDGADTLPAAPSYSAVDKNGAPITVTLTQTNTPAKGWSFELSAGDSITFSDAGKVGEKYDVYELVDEIYRPLTFIGDNTVGTYATITHITLDSMNDTNVDVINGGEGYIVLRKQFKGDISELSDELNASNISIKLELRKTDGTYIVPSASSASANITVSGNAVANAGAIKFTRNDNVIINMAGLKAANSTALLDGAFRVTETYAHKLFHGMSCYVVEPEKADGIWEFDADTKQGVLVNNVSEFKSSDVIYKRIGLKEDNIEKPTGTISFSIRDNNGDPVQGVRCFISKFNPSGTVESSTDVKYISDESGIITIDFDEIRNNGWRNTNKNMQYMLKMYFDRAVKINPSDPNVLSITENTYATDKSWGTPVGYEKYADPDTYISGEMLETSGLSQWIIADADTFVNTQDTEQISFTKKVNATGDIDPETSERIYTDEDNNTLFKFVVSELIGKDYQPAPHISYKVYNEDDELVRKGVTDYDENDKNSGWGVFTLHRGEKVVLDIPKNTYWYVGEDNTGKYKLVTDDSGEITTGEDEKALHIKPVTDISYDADYLMQGFSFHTTLDMIQGYPMSYDVVLINGRASQKSPMFAKYDESHDSDDVADDGVTEVSRTARLKSGQSAAENFYYVGSYNYTASKYNGEGILGSTISKIYSGNDESEMWSYNSGTSSAYKANSITLPDTVIIEDNEGKRTEHKIVGIGKEAYANVGLTSVNIPKYVKKIGDNAFNHNFNLTNVNMNSCTDLKVIGVAAFADGSMSIYMPDTVETVEDTAFAQYHTTSGTRNNSNNSFTIPSALCHLTNKANVPDQRFGSLGHYTSNVTLRIGGGESIPDMVTSFRTITEGKYHEIYTLGLGDIPFVPYNVIIGQNPNGLRIKEAARNHWDRNGGTNNTNMVYGRIIVFPKGDLTLEAQALRQNGQISSLNFLRVFLTEDPTDLKIEGDMDTYGNHIQYIVFPNFTRDEALADSNWTTKENYLKSANSPEGNVHIFYRDDLTSTAIKNIISDVGSDIVDDDVKELLYTSVGLSIPNPLPAPRHLAAPDTVISNNDIYLEKKKELLD